MKKLIFDLNLLKRHIEKLKTITNCASCNTSTFHRIIECGHPVCRNCFIKTMREIKICTCGVKITLNGIIECKILKTLREAILKFEESNEHIKHSKEKEIQLKNENETLCDFGPNVEEFYDNNGKCDPNKLKPSVLTYNIRKRTYRKESRKRSSLLTTPLSGFKRKSELKHPPLNLMKTNKMGETKLHIFSKKGDLTEINKCLTNGADPNVRDHAGWTPLVFNIFLSDKHEAVLHGHIEIAHTLIKHGADVNARGLGGRIPIEDAIEFDNKDLINLLMSNGSRHLNTELYQKLTKSTVKPVVMLSGLNNTKKDELIAQIKSLGGDVVEDYSSKVTQLIVPVDDANKCSRTLKYLLCLVKGKPIVSPQCLGVKESIDRRYFLTTDNFIVSGTQDSSDDIVKNSIKTKGKKIFQGCIFYIKNTSNIVSKQELEKLITVSGGRVISNLPSQNFINKDDS
ncbi:hypothetical protein HZS_328, partial [Henneguya salminicola]